MNLLEAVGILAAAAATLAAAAGLVWWRLDLRMGRVEGAMIRTLNSFHADRDSVLRRVLALEDSLSGRVSRWVRSQDGTFLSVSPTFVRLFCLPVGYAASDVVGRKLADLGRFSPELQTTLWEMDQELARNGYSARHGVEVGGGTTATIIKFCQSNFMSSDLVFLAYAVPEEVAPPQPKGGQ